MIFGISFLCTKGEMTMESFMDKIELQIEIENNGILQITENGAVGFASTGSHPLVDLLFKVSSYRSCGEQQIIDDFTKAFYKDPNYALKWLFYVRDIRGGLGERRLFRIISRFLTSARDEYSSLISYIPEYGRWDDLIDLVDSPLKKDVAKII